jgi:hypothetical protein
VFFLDTSFKSVNSKLLLNAAVVHDRVICEPPQGEQNDPDMNMAIVFAPCFLRQSESEMLVDVHAVMIHAKYGASFVAALVRFTATWSVRCTATWSLQPPRSSGPRRWAARSCEVSGLPAAGARLTASFNSYPPSSHRHTHSTTKNIGLTSRLKQKLPTRTPALCEGQSPRSWFEGSTPPTHPLGGGGSLSPGGTHPPPWGGG